LTLCKVYAKIDTVSSGDPETRKRILTETWRLVEQHPGQSVRLSDIAQAAGISRQAIYLHFASRADLLVATVRYVDQAKGVDERLSGLRQATGGLESLRAYVDFWANYIPEVYGLAKALLVARETDPAAAAAWEDRMEMLREGCRNVIGCLAREQLLAPEWNEDKAAEMLWGMMTVALWENLTIDRGWSQEQFVSHLQIVLKRTFVRED
jgi:AcrR family transcriptional regulator